MNKTQKKIDRHIRTALNTACEQSLSDISGFSWLSHDLNWTHFPASLLVLCVFETSAQQQQATDSGATTLLTQRIQQQLLKHGIKLKHAAQQVCFDNEQACQAAGQSWSERLASKPRPALRSAKPH